MIDRYTTAFLGLFVAVTAGCGGTDEGRRTEPFAQPVVLDSGSHPVLCNLTDDYEFSMLQDFELGGVADGWYFNNDQCDKCQKVIDRIKELNKLLQPAAIEWASEWRASLPAVNADKWGCNDWALSDPDPEHQAIVDAARAKYDQELALMHQKLIDGDPEKNVPKSCREVCLASQFPNTYIKPLEASRIEFIQPNQTVIEQPRCGSRYAMHVKGGPFQTWGGSFAVQLGHPGLDASEWEGISFWARVGPQSRNPLRVELSDERTDDKQMIYTFPGDDQYSLVNPQLLAPRFDAEGNLIQPNYFDGPGDPALGQDHQTAPNTWCATKEFICNGDSVREDKNGCDKFGANRTMTGDWQFYTVDFSSVRQSGWGRVARDEEGPTGLDKSDIRSLNFMWTTGTWDVWIDDVALYRRKQP